MVGKNIIKNKVAGRRWNQDAKNRRILCG